MKTDEYRDIVTKRYVERHQPMVLAIREECARDVREQAAHHDQEELGRRLVAWLLNREIDRRAISRVPGEAYSAMVSAKTTDVRQSWVFEDELRAITYSIFPNSRTVGFDMNGRLL